MIASDVSAELEQKLNVANARIRELEAALNARTTVKSEDNPGS